MAGPASTVSVTQSPSRTSTGAISAVRIRGTSLSNDTQNVLMPARSSAIIVASPETMMTAATTQLRTEMAAAPPSPSRLNIAEIIVNLARNPESGGIPASSSAQQPKAAPRIANVRGVATPISSSC